MGNLSFLTGGAGGGAFGGEFVIFCGDIAY